MADKQTEVKGRRVVSIDVLRGFAMFLITAGSGEIGGAAVIPSLMAAWGSPLAQAIARQMTRAYWGGFHFYNLAMPLFIFIVGTAMPFSFNKRLALGQSRIQLYLHIIKRAVVLFILGTIAGGHLLELDLSKLHLENNVLEYIAVGYLISSMIMLNMRIGWQVAVTAVILLLYWALLTLVPVPGYGAGVLTPEGNLGSFLDRIILGSIDAKDSISLRIIPIVCNMMLGAMAGYVLQGQKTQRAKVIWLFSAGVGCLVLALIWNNWFAIIRNLWTSTFVLFACGWCYLLLAMFYLLIDVWRFQKWAFFFIVIGMNSIALYMAAHLFDFRNIGDIFVGGLARCLTPEWGDFVRAAVAFTVMWLILLWMYRKRSFIKV